MIRVALAAESPQDLALVCRLADRVMVESVPWSDGILDSLREYRRGSWSDFGDAFRSARSKGLPIFGHFDGAPGAMDAQMIRAVLALLQDDDDPPDAVIIARDVDNVPERIQGFEQAVRVGSWSFCILGAHADPEIEAWLLVAFEPSTPEEQRNVERLRAELGFVPHRQPERLSSTSDSSAKDAKRVLEQLVGDRDRLELLERASLEVLRQRGTGCGLTAYLQAVRRELVPLVSGAPAGT